MSLDQKYWSAMDADLPPPTQEAVEQVVYSIYHMVLYSLPEGDGWLRLLVVGESKREKAIGLSRLRVHLYILLG